ncbi:RNA-binding protein NOB1-like isoform X3 [Homarus americanus]|uniref:RNA-binding protein NOB1-like isoform X3 n=1 Tax=Homarus americanus TaxID=6706 RepID=UPI001C46ED8E|nr:RNA-binding protein NOB1-like isoform X3 [Homarus americanus]
MKCKCLVVDTAAFVKNVSLWEYGEELYSLPEVIEEIRDKQTKERLEAMPVAITMRQPKPQSLKFVNEFSKKTGDYASLSLPDMKVLALTYELEVETRGGAEHLRTEPQKIITEGAAKKGTNTAPPTTEGFYLPKAQEEEKPVQPDQEGEEEPPHSDAPAEPAPVDVSSLSLSQQSETADHTEEGESHPKELIDTHLAEEDGDDEESDVDDDNASEDESDDDGWITPSNLKKHRLKNNPFQYACEEEPEEDVQVACMTADFAVQNVLKHIGLSVMGVDGLLIKHLKTFILRCHACFKTTSIMTKIFCPNCGNKTLKKVSVTLNPDGSQKIWINTKKQINIRGMKYSLPTPKGGKHGRNPILVEDQREAKRFSSKMSRKKINPLHEDFDPHHIPFAVHDVYSRAAQLGYIAGKNHYHHYWEKRNPNEPKRTTGKKKKNPA